MACWGFGEERKPLEFMSCPFFDQSKAALETRSRSRLRTQRKGRKSKGRELFESDQGVIEGTHTYCFEVIGKKSKQMRKEPR